MDSSRQWAWTSDDLLSCRRSPRHGEQPTITNRAGALASDRRRRPGVSLAVLAGVCVAFAVLFFQVVRPLALPLFLAAVFAILAFPLHERLTARCGGRGGLSALLIVSSLILLLLGPTTAGFVASYGRASDAVARLERPVRMPDEVDDLLDRIAGLSRSDPDELRRRAVQAVRDGEQLLFRRAVQAVGDVFSFGLGLLLFAVSGFFFLKDGTSIVKTWEELTPLTLEQDRQVRRQFAVVCRAVVLSTILAALAQAVTLGLGLGLLELVFGLGLGKWLVLLVVLAFVFSMVPIVGPSAVWLPLAAWMLYERQYAAGVILTAFGADRRLRTSTTSSAWLVLQARPACTRCWRSSRSSAVCTRWASSGYSSAPWWQAFSSPCSGSSSSSWTSSRPRRRAPRA